MKVRVPYVTIYHGAYPALTSRTRKKMTLIFHMQGVDPDAPEEDEENEADDVDGDQDDAELL